MTDKELLEYAAKACGLPECGWMGPAFMYVKDNTFTEWNPLTDDGDAFRLHVKLGEQFPCCVIGVYSRASFPHASASIVHNNGDETHASIVHNNGSETYIEQYDKSDMAETARRAIVRAAAAVGKGMP